MRKLLVNLALLSLGAIAFAGATLIPPMTAHAAAGGAPATGVDWAFWIALVSALGVFASFALHAIAAKTHSARLEAFAQEIDVLRRLLPSNKPASDGPTVTESIAAGVVRFDPDGKLTGIPPRDSKGGAS